MKKISVAVVCILVVSVISVLPLWAQEAITFETLPEKLTTNIPAFPVVSQVPASVSRIMINTLSVPTPATDIYAVISLLPGDNTITLSYIDNLGEVKQTTRNIIYDPNYKTDVSELMYVNHLFNDYENPDSAPRDGATVIDINNHTYLGTITDHHVIGVHPKGEKIVLSDGQIFSAVTHTATGASLPGYETGQAVVFSHDGKFIFYDTKKVDVDTLTVVTSDLPRKIEVSSSLPDNDKRI